MYNKVILVGRLTRDIELRYTPAGMAVANTAIATNHNYTSNGEKREEVCYTDITFFARSAEIANQYLRKGSLILVEGRLKLDQWTDQNGQKRSKHSVVVEKMQMLDSRGDTAKQQPQSGEYNPAYGQPQSGSYGQPQNSYQQPQQQAPQSYQPPVQQQPAPERKPAPEPESIPSIDVDMDITEDEIPF